MNVTQIERIESLFSQARLKIEGLKDQAAKADQAKAAATEAAPKAVKDLTLYSTEVLDILDGFHLAGLSVAQGFDPKLLPEAYVKAVTHCYRFAAISVFTLERGLRALVEALETQRLAAAVQTTVELPPFPAAV